MKLKKEFQISLWEDFMDNRNLVNFNGSVDKNCILCNWNEIEKFSEDNIFIELLINNIQTIKTNYTKSFLSENAIGFSYSDNEGIEFNGKIQKINNELILTFYNTEKSFEVFCSFHTANEPYFSFINERKICDIASDSLENPRAAYNINFKSKTDGTHELTFDINYRYWDQDEQDFIENPIRKYLYNEAKVKLHYKNKWYDFVIKSCDENSENKKFSYTCKDIYIDELGRNGYNVEFATALGNNVGSATELAAAALKGSDWTVAPSKNDLPPLKPDGYDGPWSDISIQKNPEGVFAYTLPRDLTCKEISPDGEILDTTLTILKDQTIFILYTCVKNRNLKGIDYQFYYDVEMAKTGFYDVDDDNFFINTNVKCLTEERLNPSEDSLAFQSQYRGYRYVRAQKTEWLPKIGKRVTLYDRDETDDNYDWTHYGYVKTSYLSPEIAQNVLINSTPKKFTSESGWKASWKDDDNISHDLMIELGGNFGYNGDSATVTLGGDTHLKAYYLNSDGAKVYPNSVTYENLAFKHNLKNIGALTAGEKWVYRCPKLSSEEQPVSIILNSGIFSSVEITNAQKPLEDGYIYSFYEVTTSKSYKELLNAPIEITFQTDGTFYGGEFFRYYTYINAEGKEELIVPETSITEQNLIKNEYYYFTKEAYEQCQNEKDLVIAVMEDAEPTEEIFCYYNNFQKIGTIEAKESNYFNIIQTINEKFECWADFQIQHEENGATSVDEKGNRIKRVIFKNYIGKDNWSGFKYGMNLKSIQRQVDSEEITTKTIVKANSNQFAKNGSCNIARSSSNPSKSQFLINLDYFCRQGVLDKNEIDNDLFIESNGYLGYYVKLDRWNRALLDIENQLIGIEKLIREDDVKIQASNVGEEDFFEDISNINEKLAKNIIDDIGTHAFGIFKKNPDSETGLVYWEYPTSVTFYRVKDEKASPPIYESYQASQPIYDLNQGRELVDNYNSFIKQRYDATKDKRLQEAKKAELIALRDGKYSYVDVDGAQCEYEVVSKNEGFEINYKINGESKEPIQINLTGYPGPLIPALKELDKQFYSKYYRFIREGTWTSEDYTDDDLYYFDACNVSYTSAFPKVTYTISVFDIKNTIVPDELGYDYSNYDFECGDRTTIEDTEFFGWVYKNKVKTPYKELVLISETSECLDNPESSTITVQNYKTQFDDLFQRIAATTQTLELKQGQYDKAAEVVDVNGTINKAFLQNTLMNNDLILSNAGAQSVEWGENGIITIDENPMFQTRIVGGGIVISKDGGETWTVGISGNGINASNIRTGNLDTARIRILSGNDLSFVWDENGISGFGKTIGLYDYSKYTRMDRFGFYAVEGLTDYKPTSEKEIWENNNVLYCLVKSGLRLGNGGSYIKLDVSDPTRATVEVKGEIFADAGKIGGWEINNTILSSSNLDTGMSFSINSAPPTTGNWIEAYNLANSDNPIFKVDHYGKLYATGAEIDGKITASSGKIGGWVIDNTKLVYGIDSDGNFESNAFYIDASESMEYPFDSWIAAYNNGKWPFYVKRDGSMYATAGKIGGWEIKDTRIQSTDFEKDFDLENSVSDYGFYINVNPDPAPENRPYDSWIAARHRYVYDDGGNISEGIDWPFYVTKEGILHAEGAVIEGKITATSGTIGTGDAIWNIGSYTYSGIQYGTLYGDAKDGNGNTYIFTRGVFPAGDTAPTTWYNICNGPSSDRDVKKNIEKLSTSYDKLFDLLKPVRFKYKENNSNRFHTGFIVQDVLEGVINSGLTDRDFAATINQGYNSNNLQGNWHLRYNEFIALNTWQIQKLKTRVSELESQLKELKSKIN